MPVKPHPTDPDKMVYVSRRYDLPTGTFSSEAVEKIMKLCQAGTTNYNDANNLHAECYRTIGQLLTEVQRLNTCLFQMQNAAIDLAKKDYKLPKEWVGLTDDEIIEIRRKTFDAVATNYEVYRAIADKLRSKNG